MYILCSFSLITRTSARHDFMFLSFCIFEIDFFFKVTNNNFFGNSISFILLITVIRNKKHCMDLK